MRRSPPGFGLIGFESRLFRASCPSLPFGLALALLTLPASGMPSGIATPNCNGCHEGEPYQGELALIPGGTLVPGERAEFTLRIIERDMAVAGYFVTAGLGTFDAGSANRTSGDGIVHSMPAVAEDGVAAAKFFWTPPTEPGGADFGVYVIAANDDRTQMGDRPASAIFSYVWGCEGLDLYEDIDGDGFGSETGAWSLGCEAREGWSTQAGDCNDFWASIYPGAPETADGRDEDCNGEVDDGIVITTWYIDEDLDGFGYGVGVDSDIAPTGYVGNRGDCDDEDAEISPDAAEVCDGRDNDCNQRLDDGDGVFITCGVGLCGRVIEVCDRECTPGSPTPELCNGLDDDCDGEADEEVTCPAGMECVDFSCVAAGVTPGSSEASAEVVSKPVSDSGISTQVDVTAVDSSHAPASEAGLSNDIPKADSAGPVVSPDTANQRASGCSMTRGHAYPNSVALFGYSALGFAAVARCLRRRRRT